MYSIMPLGDRAIVVEFGSSISLAVHQNVQDCFTFLMTHPISGVVEIVPAYCSVTLYYEPSLLSYSELEEQLRGQQKDWAGSATTTRGSSPFVYEVPTLYGGSTGPDLPFVASFHGLQEDDVIALHSGQDYLIYMIGFLPGFPYLGNLPSRLVTPRLAVPRLRVEAGSVGIGGAQTGIYPLASPGGWQIIGQTPLPLFDPSRQPPSLLAAGHYVRFVPISKAEFLHIKGELTAGRFAVNIHRKANTQTHP